MAKRFHYLHRASTMFAAGGKMRVRVRVDNDWPEASVYISEAPKGPEIMAWWTTRPEGIELVRQVGNGDCPPGILADWVEENPVGHRPELSEAAALMLRRVVDCEPVKVGG